MGLILVGTFWEFVVVCMIDLFGVASLLCLDVNGGYSAVSSLLWVVVVWEWLRFELLVCCVDLMFCWVLQG